MPAIGISIPTVLNIGGNWTLFSPGLYRLVGTGQTGTITAQLTSSSTLSIGVSNLTVATAPAGLVPTTNLKAIASVTGSFWSEPPDVSTLSYKGESDSGSGMFPVEEVDLPDYPSFGALWTSIFSLFGDINTGPGTILTCAPNGFAITGNCEVVANSWTLPASAISGEWITIENAENVEEVIIDYVDGNGEQVEIIVTAIKPKPTGIEFLFPNGKPKVGNVTVSITSTQFTGIALVGTLSAVIYDGSGIYFIEKNKRNDTIYTDSATDDDTVDLKIPDPFARTGFIGG